MKRHMMTCPACEDNLALAVSMREVDFNLHNPSFRLFVCSTIRELSDEKIERLHKAIRDIVVDGR